MARTLRILATALVSVVVLATAGLAQEEPSCRLIRGEDTPEDPSDDVSVCRQDVWFHAVDTPIGNTAALDAGSFPTWDTTEPSGPGAAYAATSTFHQSTEPWDPRGTATFDGTFTGDIDTLGMTFHLIPTAAQTEASIGMNGRIRVDGEDVWDFGGLNVPFAEGPDHRGIKTIKIAFVNLYSPMEQLGLSGADREHEIRISSVGLGLATASAVFVYDNLQTPSGMIFNIEPENLEGYTIVDAAF